MAVRTVFSDVCEQACALPVEETAKFCAGVAASDWLADAKQATCDKYEEMLPRPLLHDICKAGIDRGAAGGCGLGLRTKQMLQNTEHAKAAMLEATPVEEEVEEANTVADTAEPEAPAVGLRGAETEAEAEQQEAADADAAAAAEEQA